MKRTKIGWSCGTHSRGYEAMAGNESAIRGKKQQRKTKEKYTNGIEEITIKMGRE